jgi:excisionase family DNA binding protein
MANEPLMTIDEVAKFLKVTQTTIRRWTDNGQLKCYRIGNKKERRFEKNDVFEGSPKTVPLPGLDFCLLRVPLKLYRFQV